MTATTPNSGQLFTLPYTQPLSADGKILPSAYRMFYYTNSTTQAPVFQDAAFATPYTQPVFANANGQFPPVYLNPSIEYRSQLFNVAGMLLEDCDHVNTNTGGTPYVAGYARSAIKATTTTRINGSTLLIDPDLQVSLSSAGTYKIDLDVVCTAGTAGYTPGIQLYLSYSAPIIFFESILPVMGTVDGAVATQPLTFGLSPLTLPLGTTALSNTMRYSGTVQVSTPGSNGLSPGQLALYWTQAGPNASPTSILAGSSLNVLQVA